MKSTLERAVVGLVIGTMSLVALAYDVLGLMTAWEGAGLVGLGRAISAVCLGWMSGWYFTVKFQPTHHFLLSSVLALAGHLVAALAALIGVGLMATFDMVEAGPDKASALGLTAVSFAPVSAWFATQLDDERSVHVVSGFGIGALTYIVLFGIPG